MNLQNFMTNDYFKVIRGGLNSTFQDNGRENLYHIGLPFSGAMDKRNFLIANKLINNNKNDAVIEFALQGPQLKYSSLLKFLKLKIRMIFIKTYCQLTGILS